MIASVVEEIITYVNRWEYEIILVCDCSPDHVWEEIKKLQEKYSSVHGILFSKNFGQHSATLAGYRHATGDIIVTMDDDGQSDPSAISRMIDKLHEGYDVVYAKYPSFEKSPFRVLGSWLNRKMAEILTDKPTGIQGNSFYAMQRFVKDEMVRYTNSFPYLGGLVFRVTSNITEIDVEHRGRKEGTSNYTLGKLVKLWVNGFTAFSVLPLRIASLLGIIFSCIGFILGLVFVVRKLLNPEIILGFTSIIVIVLFLGGVILLAVGLIGEYVGRIYIGQNQAPQYVIREKTWKTSIEENSNGAADH
jgi:undecaprenyl-phosphate 4-deoxy-4-formamido-L-arabinose transferase